MTLSNSNEPSTASVLLSTSPNRRWSQVRADLQTRHEIQPAGDRQRAAEAVPLAAFLGPDVILLIPVPSRASVGCENTGHVIWEGLTSAICPYWVNVIRIDDLSVVSRTISTEVLRQVGRNCRHIYRIA